MVGLFPLFRISIIRPLFDICKVLLYAALSLPDAEDAVDNLQCNMGIREGDAGVDNVSGDAGGETGCGCR